MKRLVMLALVALLSLGIVSVSSAAEGMAGNPAAGAQTQGKATKKHSKKHAKKKSKKAKKPAGSANETK